MKIKIEADSEKLTEIKAGIKMLQDLEKVWMAKYMDQHVNSELHPIQVKLLELKREGFELKGYRKIGEMIGVPHPQQVKHHLLQLKLKGLI